MVVLVQPSYRPRLVDRLIADLVAGVPAVSVVGPRASGKTTTARRYARTVIRLDRPEEAAVVEANPDAALRQLAEPVLIDEWQEAPAILGAVKRSVDDDPRPGRYLLTGSVRAELSSQTWPGTGRVIHVPMTGLTVREVLGDAGAESFIDRVARAGARDLRVPDEPPDIRDYLDLAFAGGFPEPALRLPAALRRNWYDSYLQQLLTRDAPAAEPRRDPTRLRRYFEALAVNTAGVVTNRTVQEAAGIDQKTAEAYDSLLQNLYVVDAVPAWFTNRLKRLVRTPKRYVVDPALAAAAARADVTGVMRDADLLGRLLDTFVTAQLRAELPVATSRPRLYHVREQGGRREADLLVELDGHRVIAIEIKASASPRQDSARHLTWLRDELEDRFVHGLVLHAGRYLYELSDRITAVPICTLWT
jgi:uncharacterized protein